MGFRPTRNFKEPQSHEQSTRENGPIAKNQHPTYSVLVFGLALMLMVAVLHPAHRSHMNKCSFGSPMSPTRGARRASERRRSCDGLHQLQDGAQRQPLKALQSFVTPFERRHYCPGCKSTIRKTSTGFSLKEGVRHTCNARGSESVFCCATCRDAGVTVDMEKK